MTKAELEEENKKLKASVRDNERNMKNIQWRVGNIYSRANRIGQKYLEFLFEGNEMDEDEFMYLYMKQIVEEKKSWKGV